MFVSPIRRGLVSAYPDERGLRPKRQTIRRRGKRRHARPGETLQLYTGMRTKKCQLIGRARCTDVRDIHIAFRKARRGARDWVKISGEEKIDDPSGLNKFAHADGFFDWMELRQFWRLHHKGVEDFDGVIIRWKPL